MSNRPAIYLIGDSISIDCHPHLNSLLAADFQYRRKSGMDAARKNLDEAQGANGGDSGCVLAHLRAELAAGLPEETVAINCGLHDIKRKPDSGNIQVPAPQYRENLLGIVQAVRGADKRLIWIRTTPVDEAQHRKCNQAFHRREADLAEYNRIADEVMHTAGADTVDLYSFTAALPGMLYRDHVHFLPDVVRAQAGFLRRDFDRLLRPGTPALHTFLGDSITDASRDREDPDSPGDGYVRLLAASLPALRFRNLGISGNRISDLCDRLGEVPLESRSLTLYGGINDVVHLFKRNRPQSLDEFESDTVRLLDTALRLGIPLRMLTPFLCEADPAAVREDWRPLPGEMYRAWRAALEPRLRILRAHCGERGIPCLKLDPLLSPLRDISQDGVHPNEKGHRMIADALKTHFAGNRA